MMFQGAGGGFGGGFGGGYGGGGFGGGFGGGGFGFGAVPTIFEEQYRCFPVSFADKSDKEKGDKIILPQSAFEKLARMDVSYPLQFQLRNDTAAGGVRTTHVGVLEFTADEGKAYIPYWIMQSLLLPEGGYLTVHNVTLPLASYVKFRPRSCDFLDISNPKAVLETVLRNFSCLTKGNEICINYNERNYFIDVVEVKPQDACSIVEADVKVDFDTPVGYIDPRVKEAAQQAQKAAEAAALAKQQESAGAAAAGASDDAKSTRAAVSMAELAKARERRQQRVTSTKSPELRERDSSYVAFSGSGRRVDGKQGKARTDGAAGSPVARSNAAATAPRPATAPAGRRRGKWASKLVF